MKRMFIKGMLLVILFSGCIREKAILTSKQYPPIYPNYTDIDIPVNIAPLNFYFTDSCDEMKVFIKGKKGELTALAQKKVSFPVEPFHRLLAQNAGDTLHIFVSTVYKNKQQKYHSFYWYVRPETIDPYLTYRLIEPGYEVFNKLSICQRNVTNFEEKVLADNNLTGGSCMNCHITNKHNPQQSFFHIRSKQGGTIIAQGDNLRKIDTHTSKTLSAGVYGNWHPSGHFIAFSTNVIIPEFHSVNNRRMEVYDTTSDLMVLDIDSDEVFTAPEITRKGVWETFPEFSADGKKLFFCVADSVPLPKHYKELKYSLCSIDFNAETRTFGHRIDTLFSSKENNQSASFPKASPDGNYLMFTVADYGTFPIWHNEAVLYVKNLKTGELDKLPAINEKKYSNSYHSWSGDSRWFVFASKRDNGMYGKPYFSYIRDNGTASKPFVLPQKEADFYDFTYKSFNLPELRQITTAFDARDIEKAYKELEAEKASYVETLANK